MSARKLLISFLVFPACVFASPAEDKRLQILLEEKQSVVSELAVVQKKYAMTTNAQEKKLLEDDIRRLFSNVQALDMEIKHTGKIPAAFKGGVEKTRGKIKVSTNEKEKSATVNEPTIKPKSTHSWDIFNDH